MDPYTIPAMIFTLTVLVLLGGFVLLFPITRRLGQFLEYRMSEKGRLQDREEIDRILRALEALRDDVARLAERQEFTERLLDRPDQDRSTG